MSIELYGAKIIGVGTATKGLRKVTNQEISGDLQQSKGKARLWWKTEDARLWWQSNDAKVQSLWNQFLARYKKKTGQNFAKSKEELAEDERLALFDDIAGLQFETSDEWIRENIGVGTRYFADPGVSTVDLAEDAAREAMEMAKLKPEDIDGIYFATVSPDYLYSPPPSALLQQRLGIPPADAGGIRYFSFADVTDACSSFMVTWKLAYQEIHLGNAKTILLVGADVMSSTISPFNRNFYPILGDAARVLVLQRVPLAQDCFSMKGFYTHLNGELSHLILTPAGGSKKPITLETLTNPFDQGHKLDMQGPLVRKHAEKVLISKNPSRWPQTVIIRALEQYLGQTIRTQEDVAHALITVQRIVFHQANKSSINEPVQEILRALGYVGEFYDTMEEEGNTTSGSVPGCIIEAWKAKILKVGMKVFAIAFGGGFTAGSCISEWPL